MTKPELMIASWPANPIKVDDYHYNDSTTASRVYLRMVNPEDKWGVSDEARAANDLGLYVWADIDGTVSIDVRAMDIHSATLRELEARVKLLKRLNAKAEKAGFTFHNFHRDTTVYEQLIRCLDAMGIKRSVEYHGINAPETFAPVGIAVKRIADAFDNQLQRMRQRKAA